MLNELTAAPVTPDRTSPESSRRSATRHVAVIGNYPPRRCGIATFTADVADSLGASVRTRVVAMSDTPVAYDHPVTDIVRHDVRADYKAAAQSLNRARVDVVSLQHEFGIFGGDAGDYVLDLLEALDCPVVATLHTVLENPNDDQRRVLCAIVRLSRRVIVMSEIARAILIRACNAPPEKIVVVPHGAPDRPMRDPAEMKAQLGFEGRRVLMTFGLLSPNKGIETVIEGLPEIVRAHPDVLYLVLGATHPHLLRREGEAYLDSLKARARALGVADHVRFEHRYTSQAELLDFLEAADIYVTPYLSEAQVTSGTLAYAVALGKPVVSTPYLHARELLADDIGVITPFRETPAMTAAIIGLLDDDAARLRMADRAYTRGRETIWARSGDAYRAAFDAAIREANRPAPRWPASPPPTLSAVTRLTDDCGIVQHGCGVIADRSHGYCLDDAVRGLLLVHRMHALGLRPSALQRLAHTYAAFVQHAWNPDAGAFRNFMAYDRRWLESVGSQDSMGRTFWALGEVAHRPLTPAFGGWARRLLHDSAPALGKLHALRANAFTMLGMRDEKRAAHVGAALQGALHRERRPGWIWFEPTLTYDNARLPEALLVCAEQTGDATMRADALEALRWLGGVLTGPGGVFQPAGNASFHARYASPARYDQQPLEATAMSEACARAYRATGDVFWRSEAQRAHAWFHGANSLSTPVVDADGAAHDGLTEGGLNVNQGAESVLAIQMSACALLSLDLGDTRARV